MATPGPYLRERRIRLALWTAAIEGLLVLIGVLPHILIYVLAIVAILFWGFYARRFRPGLGRELAWIFATSQLLVALVPLFLFVAKTFAIAAIAIIAVGGLIFLFTEREHSS
jgi:hypothetical protein